MVFLENEWACAKALRESWPLGASIKNSPPCVDEAIAVINTSCSWVNVRDFFPTVKLIAQAS